MARPAAITDEQILDAARDAFLAEGFQASTIDIARRAGVVPRHPVQTLPDQRRSVPRRARTATRSRLAPRPRRPAPARATCPHNLELLVQQIMASFAEILPRLVALRARGYTAEPRDHLDPDSPPARFVRAIQRLSAGGDGPRSRSPVRPRDPGPRAARSGGQLRHDRDARRPPEPPRPSRAEFAARLVDLIWRGVAPAAV